MSVIESLKIIPDTVKPDGLLPICHLSKVESFKPIVKSNYLKPNKDDLFDMDLLFLFYGGIFYRSGERRNDVTQFPLAFMFQPNILESSYQIFPYDTGGLKKGHYTDWDDRMSQLDNFSLSDGCRPPDKTCINSIQKFIGSLYENNLNYLKGKVVCDVSCQPWCNSEIIDLVKFYEEGKKSSIKDQRRCSIECQFDDILNLGNNLIWMAFPWDCIPMFKELCKKNSVVVHSHCYEISDYDDSKTLEAKIAANADSFIADHFLRKD